MDWQAIAQWGWTVVTFIGGFLINELWSAVKSLRKDLGELEKGLPREYVSKADLQPLIRDVRDALARIESRLDHKQDKGGA
jgi:hypothetical protein